MTVPAHTNTQPLTVADLSREHAGWLVRIDDPEAVKGYREVVTIGARSWEYEGVQYVGVLTDEGQREGWAGTERRYQADTPCEPVRLIKRTRTWKTPRPVSADPKGTR